MTKSCGQHDLLLDARELKKSFDGRAILNSVNVTLRRGQVVVFRGENGSGKTSLLNILTGNLEPDSGSIQYLANGFSQRFCFPRRWSQRLKGPAFKPEFSAMRHVVRTWQDTRLFVSATLSANVAVARPNQRGENPSLALVRRFWSHDEDETMGRARALLRSVGLPGKYEQSANHVSLGEAKRVSIARALASGAEVLFLDEPLSGLDHAGAQAVVEVLSSIARNQGTTLVIVEHVLNQHLLQPIADTDWLLEDGKVTVTDLTSQNPEPISSHRIQWRSFLSGHSSVWTECRLPRGALLTRIRKPGASTEGKRILEIRDLVAGYRNRVVLGLNDHGDDPGLNLELFDGELGVLEAPNGWGKSTLAKVIAGLHSPQRGAIFLDGQNIYALRPWERAKAGLRILPANSDLFPGLRVAEVLRLAGNIRVTERQNLLHQRCSSLSGGERQRVALSACPDARMTVQDEPFLSLDQPTIANTISRYMGSRGSHLLLMPRAL